VIKHFAGAVTYDASSFLEKNNDSLFGNLSQIMSSSTNEIIKVIHNLYTFDCISYPEFLDDFFRLPDAQQKDTRDHNKAI